MSSNHLALDLGAESGRVMLGRLSDSKLEMHEMGRFKTGVWPYAGTMRWNLPQFLSEMLNAVKKAQSQDAIDSLSCDSWGVDYVLFSKEEPLFSLPYHYRDTRTQGIMPDVFKKMPADDIYGETGIQFMELNTIFQMYSETQRRPRLLNTAESFLHIADYVHYLLSGVALNEESMASTSQIYSPKSHSWSGKIIDGLSFPSHLFPKVVPSATVLGDLNKIYLNGSTTPKVIATCSHDTGAAVAAVPAEGDSWAYLSSGTWSLLGLELPHPIINEKSRALNFTNEIGYGGSIRFLKNIVGMWILQECKRDWESVGHDISYIAMEDEASKAPAFKSFIRPDHPIFAQPGQMVKKIQDYCKTSGQPIPQTDGEIVRCVVESLALLYGSTLRQLEELSGKNITRVHIVGGGSKNLLLNQLTADATNCEILAGPSESTAIGNLLLQALALGKISSIQELRSIVKNSFEIKSFMPSNSEKWEEARNKFQNLTNK